MTYFDIALGKLMLCNKVKKCNEGKNKMLSKWIDSTLWLILLRHLLLQLSFEKKIQSQKYLQFVC